MLQLFFIMEYYQYSFQDMEPHKCDMLVAMLSEAGFSGFEETVTGLLAFIEPGKIDSILFENIISVIGVNYSISIIKEKNWNEQWESGFNPVTVNHPKNDQPFVHIRAGFHQKNNLVEYDIDITPKMSFGTGHHDTTYLMISQMALLDMTGKHVIDFGTGTGVLAILAEKMGASAVLAIDNDDWSISNATENISKNNCLSISLLKAESIPAGEKASVILANINLNIIISSLRAIRNACMPETDLLFSGILAQDEPVLLQALKSAGFSHLVTVNRNGWLIIRAKVEAAHII